MITQDFITEFEVALLKAHTKASKKTNPPSELNFATLIQSQEQFMQTFMATFDQQQEILVQHIQRGGHHNPAALLQKIRRTVEMKVRSTWMQQNRLEETAFKKVMRELRNDVRTTFYNQ